RFQPATSSKPPEKKDSSSKKEASSSGRTSAAGNKRKSEEKTSGSKKKRRDSLKSETDNDSVSDISSRTSERTGFDRGLEAEKILGASDSSGGLT
ncbi:heterochromatin protein 1-like, partial [Rhagoletis pomonella]|uniref:heterochromatin protein 1-like n=1 Tax=Rhagoletis pomonella TaxID=28610 RepID=UPI001785BAC6